MAAKFEKVSRFADHSIQMPYRATEGAAGYDFIAAEDTIIPSLVKSLNSGIPHYEQPLAIEAIEELSKKHKLRPTLVSTGVKCKLDKGTCLQLFNRSSGSYKNLLVVANGTGLTDSDYYNCAANEGEIFFQFFNLSPWDIIIKKGDRIGQGVITNYFITEDDNAGGQRVGGFGSSGR